MAEQEEEIDLSYVFGKFYKFDTTIDRDAAEKIVDYDDTEELLNLILSDSDDFDNVDNEIVKDYIQDLAREKVPDVGEETELEPDSVEEKVEKVFEIENETSYKNVRDEYLVDESELDPVSRDTEQRDFSIVKNIGTDTEVGEEDAGEYKKYFRSKHNKLKKIARKHHRKLVPTKRMSRKKEEEITVGGLVKYVRDTRKGNTLMEVQDTTGSAKAVFTDKDEEEKAERVMDGEYVIIKGTVSDDAGIIFGDELHSPDVPGMNSTNTADRDVKAVFISDTHFGADVFAKEKWKNFVKWIQDKKEIEYLFLAGDVVEGVGVYPGQIDELDLVDIYDQYKISAEALGQLPDDIDIFVCTGNHDRVRLAEPQLALEEEIRGFFKDNVHFTANPSTVKVDNVEVLMYHGFSLNQVADSTPDLQMEEPAGVMRELLIKRHLAPEFGGGTRIAPEPEDHLVIEDVPDVLHSGHVHMVGHTSYRNVNLFNTSCWVHQTAFQKKKGIDPEVGYAFITDLKNMETKIKEF